MKFYSQFQEDSWLFNNVPELLPKKGIFCEVGAFDGIQSSNTLAFEEAGWTGLCIEPDPEMAALCRKNRKCLTVNCGINHHDSNIGFGYHPFKINQNDRGQSKLTSVHDGAIAVPVMPLDFLCEILGIKPFLLSIDTEGSELEVWSTCYGNCEANIVIIEYLSGDGIDRSREINERLAADGYNQVHRTEANLIFVRK